VFILLGRHRKRRNRHQLLELLAEITSAADNIDSKTISEPWICRDVGAVGPPRRIEMMLVGV